ncbi:MAG: DNA-binding protein [Lachnospiraceae bacterium]|nr:DNA-binding protein [Lachnospiraceae bacterium]
MDSDKTDDRLKEIVKLTRLYDVYGPLLNERKKDIFESYVLDNYSLAEIADQVGISRQGVRDIVKRCSKELEEAEEKLGFLKKMDKLTDKLEKVIEKSVDSEINDILSGIISEI